MLKPGGRAAIVLPQGKFNNSSLAFIREWILKKARLLAVVGLASQHLQTPHRNQDLGPLLPEIYRLKHLTSIEQVKQAK